MALLLLGACAGDPAGLGEFEPRDCGGGPVSLMLGQSARAAAGVTACRLAAEPGAEYALAFVDASAIRSAEHGMEGVFPDYLLSVSLDAPAAAGPPAAAAAIGRVPVGDLMAGPPIDSPADRDRPWVLDEQFEIRDLLTGTYQMARVVRIYDGRYVVAWMEQGDPARLPVFLPRLDSAYAVVRDVSLPLLRSSLADAEPRSSAAAGQYLILLSDTLGANIGLAVHTTRADSPLVWIQLKVMPAYPFASLVSLLTHEMTHSYQFLHMHATRQPGSPAVTGGSLWAVEGGANLLSYFSIGRYAGIAPDANRDWRAAQPGEAAALHARRAQPVTGEFTAGYDHAMGLLRDLVLRRMAAGEPVETALREVSRGAIEGWFGHDGFSVRTGLTARMRSRLGQGWEPVQAMLDWTLSHAADDRTPNPVFQDRASLRVWDIPAGGTGWREGGSLSSSSGGSLVVARRYGSPLFVYLRDDGGGLNVTVHASLDVPLLPGPALADYGWQLVRIK